MPAKIFYDQDADLGLLKGKKIAIIGYGSQGHAHALNLKDSGQDVTIGLYKGSKGWTAAEKAGFKVMTVGDAAAAADIIMILLPDQTQRQVYEESIKGTLGTGTTLMFAHGFNIHFNPVAPSPDVDVADRPQRRPRHARPVLEGRACPPSSLYQDVSGDARHRPRLTGWAAPGQGHRDHVQGRDGDRSLGEQTTLCGGVSTSSPPSRRCVKRAIAQVAYFECMHEMKLIVDLNTRGRPRLRATSPTPRVRRLQPWPHVNGDQGGDAQISARSRRAIAREWILENQAHRAGFLAMRKREADHQIEEVGGRLRKMMSWIKPPRM
jgi:ketol-acid reductoisomerase